MAVMEMYPCYNCMLTSDHSDSLEALLWLRFTKLVNSAYLSIYGHKRVGTLNSPWNVLGVSVWRMFNAVSVRPRLPSCSNSWGIKERDLTERQEQSFLWEHKEVFSYLLLWKHSKVICPNCRGEISSHLSFIVLLKYYTLTVCWTPLITYSCV